MTVFPIIVDSDIELRLLSAADAGPVFALIEQNRADFDHWMRWTGRMRTLDDVQALIQRAAERASQREGFHAGLWYRGTLVGGLACHGINRESSHTEIGYWLDAAYTGRGLATRAARAVLDYLFTTENMHRVEIQCAVENVRSRAVAERLGFTFEGVRRESEWLTTRYADHALYSLLAHEWMQL